MTADPGINHAIESLIRSIPERWTEFDHDDLSAAEQKALRLLVAAGLVERRIAVRGEMAGHAPALEFTVDATGEFGIVEAMNPVAAEMWTKWGAAFSSWKASEAGGTSPFRFIKTGSERWRLTEQGVEARKDLDVEAPSAGSAAFVGSHQRVMEFILRTGNQTHRPPVRGEGRLVELKSLPGSAAPMVLGSPLQVALSNSGELAAAFRELVVPALAAALKETTAAGGADSSPALPPGSNADSETNESPAPALSVNEIAVLRALASFNGSQLVSARQIEERMGAGERLSQRSIQPIVRRLIELGLAQRPSGDRSGTRLTLAGSRLANRLDD